MSSSIYSPDFEDKLHYFELAKKLFNENNISQASLLIESIGDKHPPYLNIYFLKSQCAFSLGDYCKALKYANEGLDKWEINKDSSVDSLLMKIKLLFLRSNVYQALDKKENCERDLEQVKRIVEGQLSKSEVDGNATKSIETELNERMNRIKEEKLENSVNVFIE